MSDTVHIVNSYFFFLAYDEITSVKRTRAGDDVSHSMTCISSIATILGSTELWMI